MRILVVIPEDWFALSHFRPLLSELALASEDLLVVSRSSGLTSELNNLGARVRSLDMNRGSLNIVSQYNVRDRLARIIDEEKPDVLYAISMQTIVLTCLALAKARHKPATILLHIVGLGYLGHSRSPLAHVVRSFAALTMRSAVTKYNTWMLAENADDLKAIADLGAVNPDRMAIIPGAGVDPSLFPQLPAPNNGKPRIAFVGRMLLSKGVDVLVRAHQQLVQGGLNVELGLFGAVDRSSRHSVAEATLSHWDRMPGVNVHGYTSNVVDVWRNADIAVVPSLGGEGLPRSILEAASCGRPIVTTDVAGCRHFVRDGVEGFLVAPSSARDLGEAIGRLATDPALRIRLGQAARERVLANFTESIVRMRVRAVYEAASRGRSCQVTVRQIARVSP